MLKLMRHKALSVNGILSMAVAALLMAAIGLHKNSQAEELREQLAFATSFNDHKVAEFQSDYGHLVLCGLVAEESGDKGMARASWIHFDRAVEMAKLSDKERAVVVGRIEGVVTADKYYTGQAAYEVHDLNECAEVIKQIEV